MLDLHKCVTKPKMEEKHFSTPMPAMNALVSISKCTIIQKAISSIYQTSTYYQKTPGDNKGYEYSRGTNPTRKALEDCLAALENGKFGLAFSSGMGATDAVMKTLRPGDEVITGNDLYGGSYRIFTKVFAN